METRSRVWTKGVVRALGRTAAALAIAAVAVAPVGATTLRRTSLEDLTATNTAIVVGKVLEVYSYWNREGTFILTDVRVEVSEILKGQKEGGVLTVTLMGGSVDELTTLIVGGAELEAGGSYVLFVGEEDLPGVEQARTIRHHCQGVFEIVKAPDGSGLRAVSQANGHPLVPDKLGYFEAPGGREGFPLRTLKETIRKSAGREAGPGR